MRRAGVLLLLALMLAIAGCSSPRDTTDETESRQQAERVEMLSRQVRDLQGQVNDLRAQMDIDRAYMQAELNAQQAAFDALWDSYNSVMDLIIKQNENRMVEAQVPEL